MTLSLVGSKPLGLGMTLEVSRDMATDGFKAYSECKVSWTVTGSGGEGAAINFNEEILFDVTHYEVIAEPTSPYKDLISAMPSMDVTHYEVIAEPTSPYKDLISAMPSMNAGPVSVEACEADLRKIAMSYQVSCE
jgi:hypothetical protein